MSRLFSMLLNYRSTCEPTVRRAVYQITYCNDLHRFLGFYLSSSEGGWFLSLCASEVLHHQCLVLSILEDHFLMQTGRVLHAFRGKPNHELGHTDNYTSDSYTESALIFQASWHPLKYPFFLFDQVLATFPVEEASWYHVTPEFVGC